jgi:hypothetical protein
MLRNVLGSFVFVFAACSPGFGQVKLDHKLTEGSYTTETKTRIDQSLTIAGMDTTTEADTKVTAQTTIGKRDAGGSVREQTKVTGLQINMKVMGSEYMFDSANPDNKGNSVLEILRDVHKAISKRSTTTLYDKENKVVSVQHDEDILPSLAPEIQKLVKNELDPENIKKAVTQELQKFPTDAVKQGDSWERTEAASFGGGQSMTFQSKYTYDGTVEKDGRKLDKITSKTLSVTYTLDGDGAIPLKLKGSELKAAESEGVILFDRELGRVIETKSSIRITGGITFEVNGMELPSKLDLKMQNETVVKR